MCAKREVNFLWLSAIGKLAYSKMQWVSSRIKRDSVNYKEPTESTNERGARKSATAGKKEAECPPSPADIGEAGQMLIDAAKVGDSDAVQMLFEKWNEITTR